MPIRLAVASDLPAIVSIYNASIPGRMATADLEPVTVTEREEWFHGFDPEHRPLWVYEQDGAIAGWMGAPASIRSRATAAWCARGLPYREPWRHQSSGVP